MVESQQLTMKPVSKSDVVASEELLGEELFLYDHATGSVHTLNSGAAMIWLLCDGNRDLGGISAEIASVSGMSEQEALVHVQKTVRQFQELGLLQS